MSNLARAVIVADSISELGIRLTTFQLRYWRPIHSELMTHRVLSRNAGSSRARPSEAIIEQVRNEPWGPIHWGANQAGMQAHVELQEPALELAQREWCRAARLAADSASAMVKLNAHKQIVNRLLEPFTYIDVLVTATDYNNWFALRDHPDAQPEIRELAQLMRAEYNRCIPHEIHMGEWHLPYITDDDWALALQMVRAESISNGMGIPNIYLAQLEIVRKISVARCARVSYKAFDGTVAPLAKDLALFEQLLVSQPLHASPAEHQATPDDMQWIQRIAVGDPADPDDDDENLLSTDQEWINPELHGNFTGWKQYRKMLPNEFVPG